jgi:hypothetical protein
MHHRLNTLAPIASIRFGVAAPSKTGGRKTLFRPTLRSAWRGVGVDG